MKKLLSLLAILVIASAAQAVLPGGPSGETFDHDVFAPLPTTEFWDWGNWASGSGTSGWGGGIGGDFVAQVNTTGGNPGGVLELSVDGVHMGFWGRSMGFVHNNVTGPRTTIYATADVKNLGGVGAFVMKVEWFGGINKLSPVSIVSAVFTGLGTGWTNVGMAAPTPVGGSYYTIVVMAEGSGTSYLVDNVTPEPITIALLGLGGLFLRRRK